MELGGGQEALAPSAHMARCLTEFVLSTSGVDHRHSLACTPRVLFWPTPTLTSPITIRHLQDNKKTHPSRLVPTPLPPSSPLLPPAWSLPLSLPTQHSQRCQTGHHTLPSSVAVCSSDIQCSEGNSRYVQHSHDTHLTIRFIQRFAPMRKQPHHGNGPGPLALTSDSFSQEAQQKRLRCERLQERRPEWAREKVKRTAVSSLRCRPPLAPLALLSLSTVTATATSTAAPTPTPAATPASTPAAAPAATPGSVSYEVGGRTPHQGSVIWCHCCIDLARVRPA